MPKRKRYVVSLKRFLVEPAKVYAEAGDRQLVITDFTRASPLLITAAIVAALTVAGTLFMLLVSWPVKVLTITRAEIVEPAIAAGELAHIRYAYCKHQPFEAVAVRAAIVTGGRVLEIEPLPLRPENSNAPLGCSETVIEGFVLPATMPIESYGLSARARMTYEFRSGLRTVHESYWTTEFMVLAPAPAAAPPVVESLREKEALRHVE